MKLDEADIRSGDVLLFEGLTWSSLPVQLWSLSPFVHAGQALWMHTNGFRRLYCVEAMQRTGIKPRPLDNYLAECQGRYRIHWYALREDVGIRRLDLVDQMDRDIDIPYPALWTFTLAFLLTGKWLSRKLGLPADLQPKNAHCSESIARRLFRAGYVHDRRLEPAQVSPGELSLFTCLERRGILEV